MSTVSRAWWWANKIVHNNGIAIIVVLSTSWCPCLFYSQDPLRVLSCACFFGLGLCLQFNNTWRLHCIHAYLPGWLHKSCLCWQIDLYSGRHVCHHWVCNLLGGELDCACTEPLMSQVYGYDTMIPMVKRLWNKLKDESRLDPSLGTQIERVGSNDEQEIKWRLNYKLSWVGNFWHFLYYLDNSFLYSLFSFPFSFTP
jgi:hypothetical protein